MAGSLSTFHRARQLLISASQMYKQDGTLVAVMTQEGVIRADVRGPEATAQAKL